VRREREDDPMLEPGAIKIEVSLLPATDERPRTPEERLMVALLEEALASYERGLNSTDPMVRQASREVDDWVRSHDSEYLFSFESVCEILGLDAECLRAGFSALRREARAEPQKEVVRKLRRTRITDRRVWRGRIG
jgi:PAS domain-containing protein